MYIDRVEVEGNTEKFIYKCPNKQCNNYGYTEKEVFEDKARQDYIDSKLEELKAPQLAEVQGELIATNPTGNQTLYEGPNILENSEEIQPQ
jgi:hypothetical protein